MRPLPGKLAVAHHRRDEEHRDEDVKEHPQFNQHRRSLHDAHPERIDTIFEDQIAEDLGERFLAADNEKQASQTREECDRDNERRNRYKWEGQAGTQPERERQRAIVVALIRERPRSIDELVSRFGATL